MGKYLTNFKTKEEYEAFRGGNQYITPNVSFVEDSGSIINDQYQIPGGGGGSRNIDYLDIATGGQGIWEIAGYFGGYARVINTETNLAEIGNLLSTLYTDTGLDLGRAKAVAIDKDMKISIPGSDKPISLLEVLDSMGPEMANFYYSYPHMTEEEFYSLEPRECELQSN